MTARTLEWDYNTPDLVIGKRSPLVIDAIVTFDDTGTIISGENLWKLNVFGSENVNGLGDRIGMDRQILMSRDASSTLLTEFPLTFDAINTRFDFSTIGCNQYQYLCLEFEQGDDPDPPFVFQTKSGRDSIITCKDADCISGELLNPSLSFIKFIFHILLESHLTVNSFLPLVEQITRIAKKVNCKSTH